MPPPPNQPNPLLIQPAKKSVAGRPIRLRMPRREAVPALVDGQVPLGVGDHLPRVVVHRLHVVLAGFVEEIVAVGVAPPLAQAWGVREQPQHLGGAEDGVPELGDVGDVGEGDWFYVEGRHFEG